MLCISVFHEGDDADHLYVIISGSVGTKVKVRYHVMSCHDMSWHISCEASIDAIMYCFILCHDDHTHSRHVTLIVMFIVMSHIM